MIVMKIFIQTQIKIAKKIILKIMLCYFGLIFNDCLAIHLLPGEAAEVKAINENAQILSDKGWLEFEINLVLDNYKDKP